MGKKFTIIRDTREHEGHGWKWNKSKWCNGSKVETLNPGDYTIEEAPGLIIIERKQNFNELCNNFLGDRDRFIREMERIQENYRYLYIARPMRDDPTSGEPVIVKHPVTDEPLEIKVGDLALERDRVSKIVANIESAPIMTEHGIIKIHSQLILSPKKA